MLINNLASLLAERQLKAVKVANDTGIANSTLSRINNNTSGKIEYDTINTLCNYLKVTPSEFFEYTPIDVKFSFHEGDMLNFEEIKYGHPYEYGATAFLNISKYDKKIGSIEYTGVITVYGNDGVGEVIDLSLNPSKDADKALLDELKNLSIPLQTKIKNDFENYISACDDFFSLSPVNPSTINMELY